MCDWTWAQRRSLQHFCEGRHGDISLTVPFCNSSLRSYVGVLLNKLQGLLAGFALFFDFLDSYNKRLQTVATFNHCVDASSRVLRKRFSPTLFHSNLPIRCTLPRAACMHSSVIASFRACQLFILQHGYFHMSQHRGFLQATPPNLPKIPQVHLPALQLAAITHHPARPAAAQWRQL